MNHVLFLSADNINGQTGAAKFARLLVSQPQLWKSHSLDLQCYSNSETFTDALSYSKSIKHLVKQRIKAVLWKTRLGKRIGFFNYYVRKLGNTPVEKGKPLLDEGAYVILNDLWVAWNLYQRYGNRLKTIFIMHNSGNLLSMLRDEMTEKKIGAFLHNCENCILENATRIVFVSEVARGNFNSVHPEYADKTKTIYIGMEEAEERPTESRRDNQTVRFITVGTVGERKNQILAIKAMEKLKNENVTLTIVGGGPALDECRKYVQSHGLEGKVVFTGATDRVGDLLEKSDVFLMTSKDEGLPVAAQEAMAVGLPLILTDVGGCRELIDGNGILIHPVLDEVVEAIRFFADNPEMVETYGKESCSLFKSRFSLMKMQESYIDLIKEIMDDQGKTNEHGAVGQY